MAAGCVVLQSVSTKLDGAQVVKKAAGPSTGDR
jgi:hypothetical protein